MKNASLFLLLLFLCFNIKAQNVQFESYPVNETSYSALFPDDPGAFEVETSEDGLRVYVGGIIVQDIEYGLIMVAIEDAFVEADNEAVTGMMTSYLDYLRNTFEAIESKGYNTGLKSDSYPAAIGVSDEWKDTEDNKIVINAWCNKHILAVLYISAPNLPDNATQKKFLNGFRF